MYRDSDGWISQYKEKKAYWVHDGDPKRPHALLTSGKHSNGFFNSRLVIPDEHLLREAASDLLELFAGNSGEITKVETVVGPQTGATKLAELISMQMAVYGRSCNWASPAKCETGGKKSMAFDNGELGLVVGRTVLLCEDVLTTGGSVDLATSAVVAADGIVLPLILVLVNRSGLAEANGKRVIALIDRPMPTWEPGECPLCQQGSEAIRPKGPEEWARLNATY